MDGRTRKALRSSIRKWKSILYVGGEDRGAGDCPLCRLFIHNECQGCPIKERTGHEGCNSTPYEKWKNHQYNHGGRKIVHCHECSQLAKEELDFLKSLQPVEKKGISPDFSEVRVDDRVYDTVDGWGTVTRLNPQHTHPINVEFDIGGSETFMFDGRPNNICLNAAIYWDEIPIPNSALTPPGQKREYIYLYQTETGDIVHGFGGPTSNHPITIPIEYNHQFLKYIGGPFVVEVER